MFWDQNQSSAFGDFEIFSDLCRDIRKLEIKGPYIYFLFRNLYSFWWNKGLVRKVFSELNVTFCVSLEACKKFFHLGQPGSEI